MRIFERLRGKDRSDSGIERKLVGSVVTDLMDRFDEEGPREVVEESKPNCCTCCSAEVNNR
ncbi:hypothetical protein [Bradyrhizobium sp. MOS002]|uniref:hypothetical protein n=1 Tax=Bradyrhizobium sp. MOS002 TaxID=2133947 RepID=UPI000D11EAF5|nr:hypothetical protein [Bradyrhizobium sp. MOS002]PSO23160.1 hypothetical protein C7G41_33180 [Bradyrhizobium sp. MOS002]